MNFSDLVQAVAFEGKPIAVFPVYPEERKAFDKILIDHALEKIDDPDQIRVWFFKPKNRQEALRRINVVNKIDMEKQKRGYFTIDDHRVKGWAFGYTGADIEDFLLRRSVMLLVSYAMTGRAEYTHCHQRTALPCPMSMGCHAS